MTSNVLEALELAKSMLIYPRNIEHNKNKFYLGTNENINGYLNLFDFDPNQIALSVLASGDHVFNLVNKGIKNIDSFDINKLTEYYALGLKRSMILHYSYSEYLDNIRKIANTNTLFSEIAEIIKDNNSTMDKEHRFFWNELIDFVHKNSTNKLERNPFNTISKENYSSFNTIYNNYLLNEENYQKLKDNLPSANITFKECNATDLASEFTEEYDIILLSNILDYFCEILGINWGYKTLKSYEKKLSKISKQNAYIFLHYIFEYYEKGEIIFDSAITRKDLTEESIIKIPECPLNGAVILKRVKKII